MTILETMNSRSNKEVRSLMEEQHAALQKELERVVQRQKLAYERTDAAIEQIREQLMKAKEELKTEAMSVDQASALPEKPLEKMMKSVQELQISQRLSNEQKEMYAALAKWGKLIDKQFHADLLQLLDVHPDFDPDLFHLALVQHLFKTGHVAAGIQLAKEAGVPVTPDMYEPFVELHEVLRQLRNRDLAPALKWAAAHRMALERTEQHGLEFQLHRALFIQLLSQKKRVEALAYARSNFRPFAGKHMKDIQRLMCALAFTHRLERSPYKDLLSPNLLSDITLSFQRAASLALGCSPESALAVAVDAGCAAILVHIKLASVLKSRAPEVGPSKAMPVEIPLGRDFLFHSIFTCPVSREQSTTDNPPVLLHCGHVLCKTSMTKLARGAAQRFKCPYCPVEQTVSQARPVQF